MIDHDSSDETLTLASVFVSSRKNARLLSNFENNLARSRQMIVESSDAEWVCFIDSDVVLPANWLAIAARHIQSEDSALGAGFAGPLRLKPLHRNLLILETLQTISLGHFYTAQMWVPSQPKRVSHLPTAAAVFRRESLMKIGGFDLARAHTGEDLDLGERLSGAGMELWLFPDLEVIHRLTCQGRRGWLARAFRFGVARIQVAMRLPHLFWGPQIILPLLFAVAQVAGLFILGLAILEGRGQLIFSCLVFLLSWPLGLLIGMSAGLLTKSRGGLILPAAGLALLTQIAYAGGEVWGVFEIIIKALSGGKREQ